RDPGGAGSARAPFRLAADPAARVVRLLLPAGGVPASAADHRRRRRPGPPDRLRERRESAPGAGAVAPPRAQRPGGAWRAALAAGAAALHRERGVVRIG